MAMQLKCLCLEQQCGHGFIICHECTMERCPKVPEKAELLVRLATNHEYLDLPAHESVVLICAPMRISMSTWDGMCCASVTRRPFAHYPKANGGQCQCARCSPHGRAPTFDTQKMAILQRTCIQDIHTRLSSASTWCTLAWTITLDLVV
eukprot:6490207-Amphidinium_carterae.2